LVCAGQVEIRFVLDSGRPSVFLTSLSSSRPRPTCLPPSRLPRSAVAPFS